MSPLPFNDQVSALVFRVVCLIWVGAEILGSLTQRIGSKTQSRDRGSYVVLAISIWLGATLGFWADFAIPGATITWNRALIFAVGILCMLLGLGLRGYAMRVLGVYFTRKVAVQSSQTVVEVGPYRYIRHPAYAGFLLTLVGMGLALTNWVSLLIILLFSGIGFAYRILVEEKALRESLGTAYIDDMRRTRRLIPFLF